MVHSMTIQYMYIEIVVVSMKYKRPKGSLIA